MAARHLSSSLLRAASPRTPSLLSATKQPATNPAASILSRSFSSYRPLSIAEGAARAPETPRSTQQPHSNRAINSELGSIVPPNNARRSRSLLMRKRQESLLMDGLNGVLPSRNIGEPMSAYGGQLPPPAPPVRLDAHIGRTVRVGNRAGLADAIRQLDSSVARHKVKATANAQRFHERPGLKRKRLKRVRWQRRFKEGFKAAVKKVVDMKKMGW